MDTELYTKKKHVLVVDDEVELAQFYKELLQTHNYRSSTANNGVQALKLLQNVEVDAIVCDLNMPELAGDMFYTAVGRIRPHLQKKFVFITGSSSDPKYVEFLKKVNAPVLIKPVPLDKMLEVLNILLGTKPAV